SKQFYTSNSAYQRLGPTSREISPVWNPLWDAKKENSNFQYTQTMVYGKPLSISDRFGSVRQQVWVHKPWLSNGQKLRTRAAPD
ncbi:hypothetical protein LTR60_003418, partial [Cryomyces antarcticus]